MSKKKFNQKMLNDEPIGETTATFPVKKYQFYGDVSNANDDNYGLSTKSISQVFFSSYYTKYD